MSCDDDPSNKLALAQALFMKDQDLIDGTWNSYS